MARTTAARISTASRRRSGFFSSSGRLRRPIRDTPAPASTMPRPAVRPVSAFRSSCSTPAISARPLKPTDQPGAAGKERYVPDDDPGKTMLGEVQWAWLADRLREPAELRLIVSSIQVVAEAHGWERWGNLAARAAAALRPHPRHRRQRHPLPLGRPAYRGALSPIRRCPLSAHRDHVERDQPGLSKQPRGGAQPRLGRYTEPPTSAPSMWTGGRIPRRCRYAA